MKYQKVKRSTDSKKKQKGLIKEIQKKIRKQRFYKVRRHTAKELY